MSRTELYCTDHCNSRSQKSVSTGTRAPPPPPPPRGPPVITIRLYGWTMRRAGALVTRTRGLMVMNERVGPSQTQPGLESAVMSAGID